MGEPERDEASWRRLAERVRTERSAYGWTQVELISRSGLSRPTVQSIEAGRGSFSATTLRRLEHGLGWAPGSAATVRAGGEPVHEHSKDEDADAGQRPASYYMVRSLVMRDGVERFMATVTHVLNDLGQEGRLSP
jgi:transcriptional regulator with XRE-family HTH domain